LIAILDYGSGNLRSAEKAFATVSNQVVVSSDPKICASADALVVPGVGAFKACMDQLLAIKGDQIINNHLASGKKILGICVGMQILFSKGFEKQESNGLSVLPGDIKPLKAKILPHIGWNSVKAGSGSKLFNGIENESFYFVHSYGLLEPITDAINTITNYKGEFISAVEMQNISAVQFHPEKSGQAGLNLLKNWVRDL
jgi:glutamine amidotransferase